MDMDNDIREFGNALGNCALARNWTGVHGHLAPWMAEALTVDDVRRFFESQYRGIARDAPGLVYPDSTKVELGGNGFTDVSELRESHPVHESVSDENLRYWLRMLLPTSDAQRETLALDFLAEVWIAVVSTPAGLRVGYWSDNGDEASVYS
ncbi:MAG: hypothetical protein SF172_05400 [Burkholderiales bacterium]|nr:hypothetical protein [Burkholderiales bacterium]